MVHSAAALDLQNQLGPLELREILSSSFFGVRQRARSANTARSGTHALGTAAHDTASTASSSEPRAVRVVCVDASNVIERLAFAATAVRAATHPALIAPLQIVRERGRLGVVTSDVAGVTLARLVERAAARKEGLPQGVVLRVVLDLIAGLHALEVALAASEPAAQSECLYGGLTPDSIHVGLDGQTRVLDPGVMAAAARQGLWADDRRVLAYSAPELQMIDARYDARADTFSIGVVLWELLSCRPLFLAPSRQETIEAVCNARIARVRRERFVRGEPIAAAVANVVARALDREPAKRFQSYGELAVALREAAPAAEAEQVAAFVETIDACTPEVAPVIDETERVTAKTPRPERTETTLKMPVHGAGAEGEPSAVAEEQPIEIAAPPVPNLAARRSIAWALALSMIAIVALTLVALALRSNGETAEPKARAASVPQPAEPHARAREPERIGSANPDSPPVSATATLPPPASTAAPLPAASPRAPAAAPAARRTRPAARANSPKRPFIPDDI